MDKSKLISIVLLVIVLGVGFIAFQFYSQNQDLTQQKDSLQRERARLVDENKALRTKYDEADRERRAMRERWGQMEQQLAQLDQERQDLQRKYDSLAQERDILLERVKSSPKVEARTAGRTTTMPRRDIGPAPAGAEDYWADFVSAKAELEASMEELEKQLASAQGNISELNKDNKEMSLKIDELKKERERLEAEIQLKERTMNIMSRDLVNERQARKLSIDELMMLRDENMQLKREIVVANKEKLMLSKQLNSVSDQRERLERRISDIESILKEKSMALTELQENLTAAITGAKPTIVSQDAASVDLPPIIVKPETGIEGLRGEIIAVNEEERFIVLDLGEMSGIRPGYAVKVIRDGREIGSGKVIETRREISAADIVDVVSGYTISEGDIIIIQ